MKTIEQQVADFRHMCDGANVAKDGGGLATKYVQPIAEWLTQALQERDRIAYERGRGFERERIESTYAKYYDWYFRAYHSHVMKDFDGFHGDNSMWDKLISEIGDAK